MKFEIQDILNMISTVFILTAFAKQVMIVLYTDWSKFNWSHSDITKILFPLFNVFLLFGMWLPYLNSWLWSSICFLFASAIAVYTYWSPTVKEFLHKIFKKKNKQS